ncbi:MAG: type II secretion system minor pseudopilin GspI [Maricaulaceae bacterium]|jgi:general secretion pathway protein I
MASRVRSRRESGFTLIEAMVALGVFSVAALSLLALNAETVRSTSALEEAAYARIVADNQLVLALINPRERLRGVDAGSEMQAGYEWRWTRTITATTDPDLLRIDVVVQREGEDRVAAAVTGFGSAP